MELLPEVQLHIIAAMPKAINGLRLKCFLVMFSPLLKSTGLLLPGRKGAVLNAPHERTAPLIFRAEKITGC
jgi:hypothetical protein